MVASAYAPSAVRASPETDGALRIRADQWHLNYLKAAEAQKLSLGEGVVVAVPDTGVDPHPDLQRNLIKGIDIIPGGNGDGQKDRNSHGTSMAGLIAAHGQGQSGALGIAPRAKIMPILSSASNNLGDADGLAAGIEFAISHGADVINVSSGGGASVRLIKAIREAVAADIVVVAAAGNSPEDMTIGYPASEEGVVAVGGIDRQGEHASVSVVGPEVDLVAPAVDIYSTSYDGKYSKGTGTSSATAIVAGAAALVRSKFPDLPASEVVHRLTATAIDKGPPGHDDQYGYGVIDLVAALTADVPPVGFESATADVPDVPGSTTTAVAEPAGEGDDGATARGLATLGVIVAAAGAWALVARRRRLSDDPPPRISR
ncbi:type VII secretion-associated serine protease mycosin [Micromonospora sp. ATCC 39149]|uniref:Type VII secretion-associated serine protease mycosin n=1 Tax=Micromonospora carbonacea TaxID=47853 RepID=A0A7D6CGX5_9ACTN|nr:type VII secretion-associated serine protease mycosin [Micromonospora sp. ATCC 39149]QLK01198.1 type VII secretion-associated serine protease mycosin [Micromonospora carbonacea]